jgi:hypothetical protein
MGTSTCECLRCHGNGDLICGTCNGGGSREFRCPSCGTQGSFVCRTCGGTCEVEREPDEE